METRAIKRRRTVGPKQQQQQQKLEEGWEEGGEALPALPAASLLEELAEERKLREHVERELAQ